MSRQWRGMSWDRPRVRVGTIQRARTEIRQGDRASGCAGSDAGVGVGLGTPLGCGTAYASGPDSTSTGPERPSGRTSASNASGGASTSGAGRQPSARAPRHSAVTGPVSSSRGRTATPDDTLDAPPVSESGPNVGAASKVTAVPGSAATRVRPNPAAPNSTTHRRFHQQRTTRRPPARNCRQREN